uniref:Uncharacterized protein n=1 Tax=Ralstonia solanacearum TaxID=305 RepID=A0A0S4UZI1_RALSL|nr:protein of unknown function [Ralstonia solanacearum]
MSRPIDSKVLQNVSECDDCPTGIGAQHPNTMQQGPQPIVTIWVAIAPPRCIVWIDAIRV